MKQGDKVKVHYTGTLNDGKVFDSSEGKEPLEFTIGEKQVIKGFEYGIKAMKLNQEKTLKITPGDAYGEKVNELVKTIPKDALPKDIKVEKGGRLILKAPSGQQFAAFVQEVNDDNIVIDLNHPLAGKELTFKVKVVAIN